MNFNAETSGSDSVSDEKLEQGSTDEQDGVPAAVYTEQEIRDKVLEMIRVAAPAKKVVVELHSSLDAIKMDSLEKLSIAMDLEELFGIYITDETIEKFQTVGDFSDYLIVKEGLATKSDSPPNI